MSNDRSTSPINVPESHSRPRRGSVASGLPFTDLFSRQNNQPTKEAVNPQANRRRLSITTLGLSGSPTQTSAFGSFRRGSLSSSWGSSAPNEDAVAEDAEGGSPNSPFARRVSFGAQALRDARSGSISNGRIPPGSLPAARPSARSPASTVTSPQDERSNPSRRLGEGFNWSEALRSRAERAPSLGGVSPSRPPIREIPKQAKQKKPDFFQEKILRGDFMD
ncbi:hypothetical protein N7520_000327 [Penicillium odoratum]|uniref:uncharacterized protein n=1 Tax=Penicillium odoratum TaxID=1167516 RepID=UPI002546646D|nr:uncharacterized protein N7520_000327 [Penicillium odoratum]KAJ5777081.1 hypothetical protein N7520_000327 [Penicillium odoratum]